MLAVEEMLFRASCLVSLRTQRSLIAQEKRVNCPPQ